MVYHCFNQHHWLTNTAVLCCYYLYNNHHRSGKTTVAKVVHNQLVETFECHSFFQDIQETSLQHKGLEYLQSLQVSIILNDDRTHFASIDEAIKKPEQRLVNNRVLIHIDDVDRRN